jgi:pimeloyl-ACP methyl ester carboxylesterase
MDTAAADRAPSSGAATAKFRRGSGFAATDPAIYFDLFEPARRTRKPTVMMIHGGGHTGTCYIHTPDGRPGWAQYFAARGHRVVVPDWPGTGRSGAVAAEKLTGALVCRALGGLVEQLAEPVVVLTHSMSGAYGWQLIEHHGARIPALVAVAPGPPGNVQPPAEIVARTADHIDIRRGGSVRRVPLHEARLPDVAFVRDKLLGPNTRRFPMHKVEDYARTLQPLPPRLMFERQNIDSSQLSVADTRPFRGKKILMVTGSEDVDHTRAIDGAIADWLRDIGAAIEFRFLADHGIAGNGHMLMLEENSDRIAGLIVDWIGKTVR